MINKIEVKISKPIGEITIKGHLELAANEYKANLIYLNVIVDDFIDKYPHRNYIKDNTLFIANGKYKSKKIAGINDIPDELSNWYKEAKQYIENLKNEKELAEIEESKKDEFIEISNHSSYGLSTSNMFANSKINSLDKKYAKIILKEAEKVGVDLGDYSITEDYKISMEQFLVNLEELERFKIVEKDKAKAKKIEKLEKDIEEKNIGYKNIVFVDSDLCTGLTYYTFVNRVDKNDFNKVRHLFKYIDTTFRSDEFDSMYDSNFKGYATTKPEEVCNILYENWKDELIYKKIEELKILKG